MMAWSNLLWFEGNIIKHSFIAWLPIGIGYRHVITSVGGVMMFLVYVVCALVKLRLGTIYFFIVLLVRLFGETCSCGVRAQTRSVQLDLSL